MVYFLPKETRFRKIFLLFIFMWAFPALSSASQFKVTQVYDGDTIGVTGYGTRIKVSLLGIDAPETCSGGMGSRQPYAQEAKVYLEGLILNKVVDIIGYGYESRDVILGAVFRQGRDISLEMVRAGLAEVDRRESTPELPLAPLMEAEREARARKNGMWLQGDRWVSPGLWRKAQRARSILALILYSICDQKRE